MQTAYLEKPVLLDMRWQQQQGVLTVSEKGDDRPLAVLPWEVAPQRLSIKQGEWRWPYSGQPLNGGLNIALHDWSKGWDETEISARLNVITAGHNGKGNAVLTRAGQGRVDRQRSALPADRPGQSGRFLHHRVDPGRDWRQHS